jgi:HAD superfamily hydrolase (TIGR01484 family)
MASKQDCSHYLIGTRGIRCNRPRRLIGRSQPLSTGASILDLLGSLVERNNLMRYLALACDYDGTLALHGRVNEETLAALERLLASGRKLLLVTGRELDDLLSVFPHVTLFERVVAENGALLYRPASREEKALGDPPPEEFVQALREHGVTPLSVGRAIVATWHPHETTVLEVIRDMGLERQVIFNKGAVMVLPASVNKASGLAAALRELGLSPHNVVGVGDAENDHSFLSLCECSVAVANALPTVKDNADLVTWADHGAGVTELIAELIADDLGKLEPKLTRHHIPLGTRDSGEEMGVQPYGINLLLTGSSGSGKSTVATGLLERLAEHGYQFCIIDPEGDYEAFEGAVVLGNNQRAPGVDEVLQLLENPETNAVVNLLGLRLEDRPSFFVGLLPRLQELRVQTGRPHWVVVDEAHHLLPWSWDAASLTLSQELTGMVFITVHPNQVAPAILSSVDTVVVVGESPEVALGAFSEVLGQRPPSVAPMTLQPGEALVWSKQAGAAPFRVRITPSRSDRRRHRRKYAEGELGPDKSFYFRGPEGKLNLRAQNLVLFLQLAQGVDDATWLYHLRRGDYSRWFREAIKDETLATEAACVEGLANGSPDESRALIRAAIEQHYTLPASSPTSVSGSAVPGGRG